jgi:cyclopropane-fatty-acyl-phospholipid synthase
MTDFAYKLLEKNVLPDVLIRAGIRQLLKKKLLDEAKDGLEFGQARMIKLIQQLKAGPIAINTKEANEQHYEMPTEFFQYVLGKHMKYSSGYWKDNQVSFDQSEEDMLRITAERAQIENGQTILELGCGWGSLTLFMAKQFPQCKVTAVSNSKTQKQYIDGQAKVRGLKNVEVITADMNTFTIDKKFDRVVSVEMFEHMRNYQKLFAHIHQWLKEDGKLFVHIFTHREFAYVYDQTDDRDWIAKYFFTGGMMPSDHFLFYFSDPFQVENHWRVPGTHYQKTSEEWLKNMDTHREKIVPLLKDTYGKDYKKWLVYWRVFFMACAELWGYRNGTEWIVSHYLFRKIK